MSVWILDLNEAKFLFYIMHSVDIMNKDSSMQVLHKFEKKNSFSSCADRKRGCCSLAFLAWILLCNAGYRPRFNPCSWGIQQWQGNQIWPVQSTLRKERTLHVSKVCQRGNGWGTLMGSNEVLAVFKKKRTFLKV